MNYELFCTFARIKVYTMKKILVFLLIITSLVSSCSQREKKYVIGISQCSADIWRDKQNAELRMAAYLNDNIELCFAAAYDSDERQIQQIDSLLEKGIDLLIVAPNQVSTISPAIDRAYDKGIPVIVFERKTNSKKFTAHVSADNYEMGNMMGKYIASKLHGKGQVLEIMGLKGSSPAIERHKGFQDALREYPDITLIDTLQGDWTEPSGYNAVKGCKSDLSNVDYVFGENDRMAIGARKAFMERKLGRLPKFCGIDGLPGEDGGIKLVCDSILDASFIYPTHGDIILQVALNILEGKPYEKEQLLMSALVTHDNANVLYMQAKETDRQTAYLDQLHKRADNYLREINTQKLTLLLALIVIVLLLAVIVLYYLYRNGKITLRRQHVVSTLWNMDESKIEKNEININVDKEDNYFITHFKEVIESRLDNSDLSIEDLAADMNLSRVQLYRKVKSVTNMSPVELLRTARLNRAYQLLITTEKTVSEVAYAVGFSAPSYFTKCFKEEYGVLPNDVR